TQGEDPRERCTQPFREITVMYSEPLAAVAQAFPCVRNSQSINSATGSVAQSQNKDLQVITIPPTGTDSQITLFATQCPESYNVTPWLADVFSTQTAIDSFAINDGMDAIGPRVLANRFRTGPQGDCVACKFEEFFLSSWPNGDPSQVSTA